MENKKYLVRTLYEDTGKIKVREFNTEKQSQHHIFNLTNRNKEKRLYSIIYQTDQNSREMIWYMESYNGKLENIKHFAAKLQQQNLDNEKENDENEEEEME